MGHIVVVVGSGVVVLDANMFSIFEALDLRLGGVVVVFVAFP